MRGFCVCGGQVSAFFEVVVAFAVLNGFLAAIDEPDLIDQMPGRQEKEREARPVQPARQRTQLFREHDKRKDPQSKENPKLGVRHVTSPLDPQSKLYTQSTLSTINLAARRREHSAVY